MALPEERLFPFITGTDPVCSGPFGKELLFDNGEATMINLLYSPGFLYYRRGDQNRKED